MADIRKRHLRSPRSQEPEASETKPDAQKRLTRLAYFKVMLLVDQEASLQMVVHTISNKLDPRSYSVSPA